MHAQQDNTLLLRRVDDHYNHLKSLQTHYVETYNGLGMSRSESGSLLLQKPGKMLWRYDKPAGKVFVLDGKFAYFYTPGDPQAQKISAHQMDDLRTPLRFLLGHTQLQKELDHIVVTPDGADFIITGAPRGMTNRLKQLSLRVSATGVIEQMKVEEIDGATTEFVFTGMQESVPTKASDFIFTPPAGVTVVNGTPPI